MESHRKELKKIYLIYYILIFKFNILLFNRILF